MGGQHLTWENRIAIESLLKAKVSASQIAAVVGCSKRTVYREIQRGQCEQLNGTTYEMYTIYSAQKAQNRADQMNDLHKLSLIHISEPTRHFKRSRMPSSA